MYRITATLLGLTFILGCTTPTQLPSELPPAATSTKCGPMPNPFSDTGVVDGAPQDASEAVETDLVGKPAKLFYLPTSNPNAAGVELFDLNKLVGNKATDPTNLVLTFGAWWCGPCKRELKEFALRDTELRASGAAFGVMLIDEDHCDRDYMVQYSQQVGFAFPVVEDITKNKLLAQRYGVQSLPYMVVIDKDGIIRRITSGYHEKRSIDDLLQYLSQL